MVNTAHTLPVIDRPRLLRKLEGAVNHKLTVISAPPGYGKTTLATQFARQSPYPVAWHRIEARERDVPNLHQESLRALSGVFPGIDDLMAKPGMAPSDLASLIADHLRKFPEKDAVYILDDIQYLFGASGAETWLRTLIERVPSHCHVILLSRMLPDIPLTEMITRRELLMFGQNELRLTSEEIYNLASEMLGEEADNKNLSELEARLEGWPAGIVLAFYPIPIDFERTLLKNGVGPEALFSELAQSMLFAQPPDLQDFLLASSTLDRLTPEMCTHIMPHHSIELLYEIQARNLFVSRASRGLVYHTLFRSFLQEQLKNSNPDLFLSLHKRTARYHQEYEDAEGAFEHYLLAQEVELAVGVAEQSASRYFVEGKLETLLNWRDKLSQTGRASANLLYRTAIVHDNRFEYDQAEANLNEAEALYLKHHDLINLINVELERAYIDLQTGRYSQAINRVSRLDESLAQSPMVRMRILNVLGFATLYLGKADQAVQYLEEAQALYRVHADAYGRSQCIQTLATAYLRLGEFSKAGPYLQELVGLQRALGGGSALAVALNNLGFYYLRDSDYKQAFNAIEEGLQLLIRFPQKRSEAYLLSSYGDLRRDLGHYDEAVKSYYRSLASLDGRERSLQCSLLTSLAILRRWEGKWSEAVSFAQKSEQSALESEMALEVIIARANLLAAQAHIDNPCEVMKGLESIVEQLKSLGAKSVLVRILGMCADVAMLCQDITNVRHYLQAGISVANEIGTAQALAAEVIHSKELYTFWSKQVPESNLLTHDLRLLQQAQRKYRIDNRELKQYDNRLPISLRAFTLGQESIIRDGQAVMHTAWRAITARELFFYLLFVGPSPREQISLAFWPDSTISEVRSNFHTTLYNARKAVGAEAIIYQSDLYSINPAVDLWCDAHEFEDLIAHARLWSPHDSRSEDRLRKAVSLYQGDLLIAFDADWILAYREKLRELYLQALVSLGECRRVKNDIDEALEWFKQAVKVDAYREDIHRAIMSCYAQKGEKQKIVAHLAELQTLLHTDLELEPSKETLALVSQLLA